VLLVANLDSLEGGGLAANLDALAGGPSGVGVSSTNETMRPMKEPPPEDFC
jgi:hypothetical protein